MSEPNRPRWVWQERLRQWGEAVLGRLSVGIAFAALAMYVFLKLAHEMAEDETRRFDVNVLHYFAAHRNPTLFGMMTAVSWLAGGHMQPFVVAACVLDFALAKRFWPDGFTMLLAGMGGLVLIYELKRLFHRPRPEVIFSSLGYSFPSGHSFFALVVYGLLAYLLGRHTSLRHRVWIWSVATFAILLVGFSRMYVGEHYPSDVSAGYAVGVPWLWSCLAIANRFWSKKRPEEIGGKSAGRNP